MDRVSEWRRQQATSSGPPLSLGCVAAGSLSLFVGILIAGYGVASSQPAFRTSAETVLLQVAVLDEDGDAVLGLEESDFEVYEDGVLQEIDYFEHGVDAAIPTSIVLLIDTSSSMRGEELAAATRAARRFVNEAPPRAEIAIVSFDQITRLVQDFTSDRALLAGALDRLETGGGTALYDGVVTALDILERSQGQRQSMVVLSDGKDLDSVSRFSELRRRLEQSPVVVYAVGYYSNDDRKRYASLNQHYKAPPVEVNLNPAWALNELARLSGGAAHFPKDPVELEPLFVELAQDIRLHYLLAYSPPLLDGERRFRKIEVRVHPSSNEGSPLTVRARRGYVR